MINHLGTQNIRTERLLLRKFEVIDAADIFASWAKDPENVTYLTWNAHKDVEETRGILQKWLNSYQNEDCYKWCITLVPSRAAIGCFDVSEIEERIDCGNLHYVLSKNFWNNGIMTEALTAVLAFLFNYANFNRVTAGHDIRNQASGRVMRKVGMRLEGVAKAGCLDNCGNFQDFVNYAITREDWLTRDGNQVA
ncbi:MAG: GNAT family N-acetyltransferase [Oscillospiraceae bacterium]|nr:GNAT family N-acetyltransferase [Oscillospiraceae bacterium]